MSIKVAIRVGCAFLVFSVAFAEDCPIPQNIKFLPDTDAPSNGLPKLEKPDDPFPPDCDFYRWAWQTFLYTTHKGKKHPRFLEYSTFQDVFKVAHSPLFAEPKIGLLSLAPRTIEHANKEVANENTISDLEQALLDDVLIDPNGNPIWYQIHLNPAFVDFIQANDLTNVDVLKNISKEFRDLEFRSGSIEFKSAWKIIDKPSSDFITADAVIPVFTKDGTGKIVPDGKKTREVKVALLGLHVVGVIDGHPEFIWATFEHTSLMKDSEGNRIRDLAPSAKSITDQSHVITQGPKYLLYPKESKSEDPPVAGSNKGSKLQELHFDEKTQKFAPSNAIYRVFPGSSSSVNNEDEAIVSLNKHIQKSFEKLGGKDARANYSLVGAVWLNSPRDDFQAGKSFPPNDQLAAFKGFGGEDSLSNMSMESFTQNDAPNCFSCHDTGLAGTKSPKMGQTRLNVSHVLSKYYDIMKNR